MFVPKKAGVNQPGTVWVVRASKLSSVDFEHLDDLVNDSAAMSKMGLQKV